MWTAEPLVLGVSLPSLDLQQMSSVTEVLSYFPLHLYARQSVYIFQEEIFYTFKTSVTSLLNVIIEFVFIYKIISSYQCY